MQHRAACMQLESRVFKEWRGANANAVEITTNHTGLNKLFLLCARACDTDGRSCARVCSAAGTARPGPAVVSLHSPIGSGMNSFRALQHVRALRSCGRHC